VKSYTQNTWILGASGFIGSALVDQFKPGDETRLNILLHHKPAPSRWEWVNSIPGNLKNIELSWLDRFPPNKIFHLARLAGRNPFLRQSAARQGLRANLRLRDFLKSSYPECSLTYVSGSLMYGHIKDGIATEDSIINPVAFAREYIRAEQPWMQSVISKDLDVRIARPGWIIGPSSWFRAFFWKPFLNSGHIPLYGDGRQLMSLIHIDDCAKMIKALGENGAKHQIQNVIAGSAISHAEFVEIIAGHLNAPIQNISLAKVAAHYGKAEAEAIGASIPLSTLNPDFLSGIRLSFPSPRDMIVSVIDQLSDRKSSS
jgi:nucleoside-diphosphate-sugar epimerase